MKLKYVLTGILIVLLLMTFLVPYGVEKYVEQRIRKFVQEQENIEIDSIQFNFIDQSIYASQISIDHNKLNGEIDKIQLNDLSYTSLLFDKVVKIGEIRVQKPELVYHNLKDSADASNFEKSKNSKELSIEQIIIDTYSIVDGNFFISADSSNDHYQHKLFGLHTESNRFTHYLNSTFDYKIALQAISNLRIDSLKSYSFKFHKMSSGTIIIDSNSFEIDSFHLQPKDLKKSSIEAPTYSLTTNNLRISNINGLYNKRKLLDSITELHIQEINLDSLIYMAKKDKRLPEKNEYKPMPIDLIKQLSFKTTIDSLTVSHSSVSYEETNPEGESGRVFFSNVGGTLRNLSNDSSVLNVDKTCTGQFSLDLMNKSSLYVSIYYDLLSPSGDHTVVGKLSNFLLTDLNSVFIPLADVKFESGQLNSLDFNFNANNYAANGTSQFYYDDLKVILLNKKKITKPLFLGKIETLLANALVVRKSNPLRGKFHDGTISWERTADKSFLNFWWKSAFSGMKSSMLRFND